MGTKYMEKEFCPKCRKPLQALICPDCKGKGKPFDCKTCGDNDNEQQESGVISCGNCKGAGKVAQI